MIFKSEKNYCKINILHKNEFRQESTNPYFEMKHSGIPNERKFTYLKLEFRKLDKSDLLILLTFSICILIHFLFIQYLPNFKHFSLLFIGIATWAITISTPFGLRFRNIYFFITWLILCLAFLWAGTSISYLPFGSFALYQAFRIVFWIKYSKEFIPLTLIQAPLEFSKRAFSLAFERTISKREGRGSYAEDRKFMKWLVRIGFLLFMLCFFGIVGTKF